MKDEAPHSCGSTPLANGARSSQRPGESYPPAVSHRVKAMPRHCRGTIAASSSQLLSRMRRLLNCDKGRTMALEGATVNS